MVGCTFCGSENIRPSGSAALDAPVTRVMRALTFRRLYRCRSCDALFEATFGNSKRSGRSVVSKKENLRKSPAGFDPRVEPLESAGGN
jgi:hypothetical protein